MGVEPCAVSGKIDKNFGDPSKPERDKYLETLMADMGLLDIRELVKGAKSFY